MELDDVDEGFGIQTLAVDGFRMVYWGVCLQWSCPYLNSGLVHLDGNP